MGKQLTKIELLVMFKMLLVILKTQSKKAAIKELEKLIATLEK